MKVLLTAATQAHIVHTSRKGPRFFFRLYNSDEIFAADRVFSKLVCKRIQQFICRGHACFGCPFALSELPVDINRIGAK